MIVSVAHAYRRSTRVDRHELTQEGIVGLLRALERFEPDRGVPFWAYAEWWVRQAMQQVVSEVSRPMVLSAAVGFRTLPADGLVRPGSSPAGSDKASTAPVRADPPQVAQQR
jgi:hypothetical protein